MNDNNRKPTAQDPEHNTNVFNSGDATEQLQNLMVLQKNFGLLLRIQHFEVVRAEKCAYFVIQSNIESFFHDTFSINLLVKATFIYVDQLECC